MEGVDPFSVFLDDLLGAVLLLVASKGTRFVNGDSFPNNENILQEKMHNALYENLPSDSVWLVKPEAPVATASSLTTFSHALVCKQWFRVARSVHPAIIVPRNRFFSSRTFASLLNSPTLGFPSLRHLHLGESALDVVDSHLVESICTGAGSSLTHLTIHLYDRRLVDSEEELISPSAVAAIFSSCTRLVNLDLRLDDSILKLPAAISCLQQLTRLSMQLPQGLVELPGEIGGLLRLKKLNIMSESLQTLPDSFCGISSLEEIDICRCPLARLPTDFGQLRNLKSLALSRITDLVELPDSFCLLPSLTRLSLCACYQLVKLPENFHHLSSLEILELGCLQEITAFPHCFGLLPALKDFTIDDCCGFTQLPASLSASRTLTSLVIMNSHGFTFLPDDLGQISSLRNLYVRSLHCVTALPDSLSQLGQLTELKAVNCGALQGFPQSVSAMESLTSFIVDWCDIEMPPEDIGQLLHLVTVNLSGRSLARLPESFGQLRKLKELNLIECYGLCDLSASFSNLVSLETLLIFGGTSLRFLPPGFEKLSQLSRLELLNCAFEHLPEGFGQLANLRILKVGFKATYDRDGPDFDCDSESGYDIEGSCGLRAFPQSVVLLTRLEELVIHGCEMVEELPTGMGNLSSLKTLTVKNCKRLRCFPPFLASPIQASAAGPSVAADAADSAASAANSAAAYGAPPCPSLQQLEISGCPRLESLPEDLHLLPKLERFSLKDCTNSKLAADQHAMLTPAPSSSHGVAAPGFLPHSVTTVVISNAFRSTEFLMDSFLPLSSLAHLTLHKFRSLKHLISPPLLTQLAAQAQAAAVSPSLAEEKATAHTHLSQLSNTPDSDSTKQPRLELLASLEHLNISCCNLPSLPDNLSDFRKLKLLHVEECLALPSLPSALADLSLLEQLDLKSLPLLTHLPENLGQLTALRKLSIESCETLQGLPSSLTLPSSLILLSIVVCPRISRLPDSLSSLTRLSSLKLNRLPGLQRLPSLTLLSSLIKLSLEGCTMLQELPSNLGSLSALREVYLGGCERLGELPQSLIDRRSGIQVKGTESGR